MLRRRWPAGSLAILQGTVRDVSRRSAKRRGILLPLVAALMSWLPLTPAGAQLISDLGPDQDRFFDESAPPEEEPSGSRSAESDGERANDPGYIAAYPALTGDDLDRAAEEDFRTRVLQETSAAIERPSAISTLYSSKSFGSNPAQSTTHVFSGLPKNAINATLEFNIYGDFGQDTETATVYADGVKIGVLGKKSNGSTCVRELHRINLKDSEYASFAADGSVTIRVENSRDVGGCPGTHDITFKFEPVAEAQPVTLTPLPYTEKSGPITFSTSSNKTTHTFNLAGASTTDGRVDVAVRGDFSDTNEGYDVYVNGTPVGQMRAQNALDRTNLRDCSTTVSHSQSFNIPKALLVAGTVIIEVVNTSAVDPSQCATGSNKHEVTFSASPTIEVDSCGGAFKHLANNALFTIEGSAIGRRTAYVEIQFTPPKPCSGNFLGILRGIADWHSGVDLSTNSDVEVASTDVVRLQENKSVLVDIFDLAASVAIDVWANNEKTALTTGIRIGEIINKIQGRTPAAPTPIRYAGIGEAVLSTRNNPVFTVGFVLKSKKDNPDWTVRLSNTTAFTNPTIPRQYNEVVVDLKNVVAKPGLAVK